MSLSCTLWRLWWQTTAVCAYPFPTSGESSASRQVDRSELLSEVAACEGPRIKGTKARGFTGVTEGELENGRVRSFASFEHQEQPGQ